MSDKTWTVEEQAAHRKLWVEGLRSGEYEQCQNYLSVDGRYCCLAVGCEIAIKNGLDITTSELHRYSDYYDQDIKLKVYDGEQETLPKSVQDWLGLCSPEGNIEDTNCENNLTIFNDSLDWSFEDIADIIEDNTEYKLLIQES